MTIENRSQGINMLSKLKFSTKICLMGLVITMCFASSYVWLYPKFRNALYDSKTTQVRYLVESAASAIDHFAREAANGSLTDEGARKAAKEAIRSMRYGDNDYFWINDLAPKMVMHPIKPELDGSDLSQNKDPNGKLLFMEMVRIGREKGAGFVEYFWPKPGLSKPVPKMSYVKLVPQWGWIVGTGVYIDDIEAESSRVFYAIFGIVALITLGGLSLAYFTARSISRPIHRIIAGLNEGSKQVAAAAGQVSSASQSLAQAGSEQAASIEETSSSLEEMSSMTSQNADHTRQADSLMSDAKNIVIEANASMGKLTESMTEIARASEETSKIIKTIDEIAFQTNLLALNAAVEAARAGEAGAGFAVVADEVRNLAMRAAEAAHNTSGLIDDTIKKVKTGSELVAATNSVFGRVADSSGKAADLLSEIAAASGEQAQGISQINRAVAEMDKVTQQVAASSEESASAAEELSAQAEDMTGVVNELVQIIDGFRKKGPDGGRQRGSLPEAGRSPASVFNKSKSRSGVTTKKMKSSAEQAIPLEDAELKDF
jgi:methyl-accepting chemotaxis protein